MGKVILGTAKDGFCFFHGVLAVLALKTKKELIGARELAHEVLQAMRTNKEDYVAFVENGDVDGMLADIEDYLRSGSYKKDAVDLLVRATCVYLNINLLVWLEDKGCANVLKQNFCKKPDFVVELLLLREKNEGVESAHYKGLIDISSHLFFKKEKSSPSPSPSPSPPSSPAPAPPSAPSSPSPSLSAPGSPDSLPDIPAPSSPEPSTSGYQPPPIPSPIPSPISSPMKSNVTSPVKSPDLDSSLEIIGSYNLREMGVPGYDADVEIVCQAIDRNFIDLTGDSESLNVEEPAKEPSKLSLKHRKWKKEQAKAGSEEVKGEVAAKTGPEEVKVEVKEEEDCSIDFDQLNIGHPNWKKPFDFGRLRGLNRQRVTYLPHDIDGDHIYVIEGVNRFNWTQAYADGRNFEPKPTTNVNFKRDDNILRISNCRGSMRCENSKCTFKIATGDKMWKNFKYDKCTAQFYCFTCGHLANPVICMARKFVIYNIRTKEMVVYHYGRHTCPVKKDTTKLRQEYTEAVRKNPTKGPLAVTIGMMRDALDQENVEKMGEIADTFSNFKLYRSVQATEKQKSVVVDDHWFPLIHLKSLMDKRDPFLVAEMNLRNQNNEMPYVYQSCEFFGKIMLEMHQGNPKDSPMKEEALHFDGMHSRVIGCKTITAWSYHAPSRLVLLLAKMECLFENTECLNKFWECTNRMLRKISGDPDLVFRPLAWMCDEAYQNHESLMTMFGKEAADSVKTCELHFHNCANLKVHLIQQEDKAEFKDTCKQIVKSETEHFFYVKLDILVVICERNKQKRWIKWWEPRLKHMAPCFSKNIHFHANISEIGHSSLSFLYKEPVKVNDACRDDCFRFIIKESQVSKFLAQEGPSIGKGPDDATRSRRVVSKAKRKNNQFMKALEDSEKFSDPSILTGLLKSKDKQEVFVPAKDASHKAPADNQDAEDPEGKVFVRKGVPPSKRGPSKRVRFGDDVGGKSPKRARKDDVVEVPSENEEEEAEVQEKTSKRKRTNKKATANSDVDEDVEVVAVSPLIKNRPKRQRKANQQPDFTYTGPTGRRRISDALQAALDESLGSDTEYELAGKTPTKNPDQNRKMPREPPPRDAPDPNYLRIVAKPGKVTSCKGRCGADILEDDLVVLQRKAYRAIPNQRKKKWYFPDKESNIYFHLDISCAQRFNRTLKKEHVSIEEDEFIKLNTEEKRYMRKKGFYDLAVALLKQ